MSVIVDASGVPFKARADYGGGYTGGSPIGGGLSGASAVPYEAGDWSSQKIGNWLPWIRSPDAEINQFRDRMVARSRDLVRNDGWASGGITRILDNCIGTNLRLSAAPDYRALKLRFGGRFDAVWADEFRQAAEALWRGFAHSAGKWNDVERQLTVGQQFRVALRHKLVDGEGLALAYWLPDRVGYGAADYATSFRLVDPDRLSNPNQMIDSRHMRGGVELDDLGVPIGYHLREAEQNDWYNAVEANRWERVEREDSDGWQRVFHDYDRDRAGQHRGVGVFAPVLAHMKMLARYYSVELQAATIASQLGLFVKSPYDPALVQDALGADDDAELPMYQNLRSEWSKTRPAMFDGVRLPTLAPGEDITAVESAHPNTNFGAFTHEMLCVFASCTGVSVEQITQDWSRTNYSSARAALMETWKTLTRRREEFATGTATPMYSCWLQEAMENGELPLPSGAPEFIEAKTAYSRCEWLGPPRGWVDPVKEPAGSVLRMDAGISTLKQESAEQGRDWEETLDQRAIEIGKFSDLGIAPPSWSAMQTPNGAMFGEDAPAAGERVAA